MQTINLISSQLSNSLAHGISFLGLNQLWSTALLGSFGLLLTIIFSVGGYYVSRYSLVKVTEKLTNVPSLILLKIANDKRFFHRLSLLIPGFVIYIAAEAININSILLLQKLASTIHTITILYLIIVSTSIIYSVLDVCEQYIKTLKAFRFGPVRSYVQVSKLIILGIALILLISVLLDKSPMYFLTGLGALTAVIMLVFKDSILGFVASIQLAVYDMVRIGDWIELPSYNANGDVIEISLNTIKVQNFDKTIVTVPTYALLTNGVVNWRGMTEAGGRRIKRSININTETIKFADADLLNRLKKLYIFKDYIEEKQKEIEEHNKQQNVSNKNSIGARALTNLGLFRAYIEIYLKNHPKISNELTFLVRQLQENSAGIPIELYVFTNDTNWNAYEGIQADIFDHLLATIKYFDLEVFQYQNYIANQTA